MFCINFGTHGFYSLLFLFKPIDPPRSAKLQASYLNFWPGWLNI